MLSQMLVLLVAAGLCGSAWAEPAAESDFEFDSTTGTITGYSGAGGDVEIPATIGGVTVTAIGNQAFYQSTTLTSVTIPAGVKSIGTASLSGCKVLANVTFAEGCQLENIGKSAFNEIGLTSVTIPAGVTNIDSSAFAKCGNLASVTFADGSQLKTMGNKVFKDCTALTNITIPAGVTSVGEEVFNGCSSLASVTFAPGSQLKEVEVLMFNKCVALTEITMPASVTNIRTGAFSECASLTNITFETGSQLMNIGEQAFMGCPLTGITLPEGLTDIGSAAFGMCTNLTEITIPAGVTNIGEMAFAMCSKLEEVTVLATEPPVAGAMLFTADGSETPIASLKAIKVPAESVDKYKNPDTGTGWSMYAALITDGSSPAAEIGRLDFTLKALGADHTGIVTMPDGETLGDDETWVWACLGNPDSDAGVRETWATLNAALGQPVGTANLSQVTNGLDSTSFGTFTTSPCSINRGIDNRTMIFARVAKADGTIHAIGGIQDSGTLDGRDAFFANDMVGEGRVSTTYYAWDSEAKKLVLQGPVEAIQVTNETTVLADGQWYVISSETTFNQAITVSGAAHLICWPNSDVTFSDMRFDGNATLSVYDIVDPTDPSAAKFSNRIVFSPSEFGATGATMNIHGGNITWDKLQCDTVNVYGGGLYSFGSDELPAMQIGTALNVYGGYVKAGSSIQAGCAGIVGSGNASGATVHVYGGELEAVGGEGAPGIDVGTDASQVSLTVEEGLHTWVAETTSGPKTEVSDYAASRAQFVRINTSADVVRAQAFTVTRQKSNFLVTMPNEPGAGYRWVVVTMTQPYARYPMGGGILAADYLMGYCTQKLEGRSWLTGTIAFGELTSLLDGYHLQYGVEYRTGATFELGGSVDAMLVCRVTDDGWSYIHTMGGITHLQDLTETELKESEVVMEPDEPETVEATYYAWNGEAVTGPLTTNAIPVTADMTELGSGWYVVQGVVSNFTGIIVNGDVHLILADGAELVVTGATSKAGIEVGVVDSVTNSLTIYGQVGQSGKLTATGGIYSSAGIGGNCDQSCGRVTIDGGVVTAIATEESWFCAGIGGGAEGAGGTVTINGGTVTALGGVNGTGIGGGGAEDYTGTIGGSVVVINGGTVIASARTTSHWVNCVGIGGSWCGGSGTVTINGGTVTATGTFGIGSSTYGEPWSLTINGGDVTASTDGLGAGICMVGDDSTGTVTINGGTVTATGFIGAGIGGYESMSGYGWGDAGAVTINGGTVTAVSYGSAGIGGGAVGKGGAVTITGGEVTAISYLTHYQYGVYNLPLQGEGIGAGPKNPMDPQPLDPGTLDLSGYEGTHYIYAGMDTNGVEVTEVAADDFASVWHTNLYVQITQTKRPDAAAEGSPENPWNVAAPDSAGPVTAYTNGTGKVIVEGTGTPKTYAEGEEPWFGAEPPITEIIVPAGRAPEFKEKWPALADLITDGTVPATYYAWNGEEVTGPLTTNAIPVTAEMTELNSGWYVVTNKIRMIDHGLVVNGDAHLILADESMLGISVRDDIELEECPGIRVIVDDNNVTNSLSIYGQDNNAGLLIANGCVGCAGIGSGGSDSGACGTVTINGGIVMANGFGGGAGIGGGAAASGGVVTINGGFVQVIGNDGGAGIGGGAGGAGGRVIVNGGEVFTRATHSTVKEDDPVYLGDCIGAGVNSGEALDPGTFTMSSEYADALIFSGTNFDCMVRVDAADFGTVSDPGWHTNIFMRIGPATAAITVDDVTHTYPTVQEAFFSEFTADPSVTNTVTLLRDCTYSFSFDGDQVGVIPFGYSDGDEDVPRTARLDLNGFTLTGGSSDVEMLAPVIMVSDQSVLIVDDSSETQTGAIQKTASHELYLGQISQHIKESRAAVVEIEKESSFTLKSGTIRGADFSGNTGAKYSLGVYSSGAFDMEGGTIACSQPVAGIRRGVTVNRGTFTMTGGKIKEGIKVNSNYGEVEEVSISGGLFGTDDVSANQVWLASGYSCQPNTDEATLAEGYNWMVGPMKIEKLSGCCVQKLDSDWSVYFKSTKTFSNVRLVWFAFDTDQAAIAAAKWAEIEAKIGRDGVGTFALDDLQSTIHAGCLGQTDVGSLLAMVAREVTIPANVKDKEMLFFAITHAEKGGRYYVVDAIGGVKDMAKCRARDTMPAAVVSLVNQVVYNQLGETMIPSQDFTVTHKPAGGYTLTLSGTLGEGEKWTVLTFDTSAVPGMGGMTYGMLAQNLLWPMMSFYLGQAAYDEINLDAVTSFGITPTTSDNDTFDIPAGMVTIFAGKTHPGYCALTKKNYNYIIDSMGGFYNLTTLPNESTGYNQLGDPKGGKENPWDVGAAGNGQPAAYTNGTGKVIVEGTGTPKTYAEGEEPWAGAVPPITEIIVPVGRTPEFKEKWPALADLITDGTVPTTYYAWNGEAVTGPLTTNAIPVTADMTELNSGWYVVQGVVSNFTGIIVKGDAHLILADGAELYANGGDFAGICVNVVEGGETNSISIYGQANNTGKLIAIGGYYGAGIGSQCTEEYIFTSDLLPIDCGVINIHGGDISASALTPSGIGGFGSETHCGNYGGTITIYGGKVNAIGGSNGAGIGSAGCTQNPICGDEPSCRVTIYGGEITAGSVEAGGEAGIGGGMGRNGGIVTIYGGTVQAGGAQGAGIGGGEGAKVGDITINGGIVQAIGFFGSAGIGGGFYSGYYGTGGTVTINGGTVRAQGYIGAGIGDGMTGTGCTVIINGGDVVATSESMGEGTEIYPAGAGIGGAMMGNGCDVTISGGEVTAISYPVEMEMPPDSGVMMIVQGEGIGAGAMGESSGTLDLSGYEGTHYIYAGMDTNGVEVTEVAADDFASVWHTNLYVQITQTKREDPALADYVFDPETGTIIEYIGDGGDVTIPAAISGVAVENIGEGAFKLCVSLMSVVIPESVTNIGEMAFGGCVSLTGVVLPPNLKSVNDGVFSMCQSLKDITIPASVTNIGEMAFWKSGLESIIFADGSQLETIGQGAFVDCSSLTDIVLPAGVKDIGETAFKNCEALKTVSIAAAEPPTAEEGVFAGCDALEKIYVLRGKKAAYVANEGWAPYEDLIVEIPNYLAFTARGGTVGVKTMGGSSAVALEWASAENPFAWSDFVMGSQIAVPIPADKTIYLRHKGLDPIDTFGEWGFAFVSETEEARVEASGNAMSLLDQTCQKTSVGTRAFYRLFYVEKSQGDESRLTSAPELPAMALASSCYAEMFYGCTLLTNAPALPATELAVRCYSEMFYGCTALTDAPELAATTLTERCYYGMFVGCTSLTNAPVLAAQEIETESANGMFQGAKKLDALTVEFDVWSQATRATKNWLSGVAETGVFTCPIELPVIRDTSHIPVGWNVKKRFTLPGPTGVSSYVVSNALGQVVEPIGSVPGGNLYEVPVAGEDDAISIYVKPAAGYVAHGQNPLTINLIEGGSLDALPVATRDYLSFTAKGGLVRVEMTKPGTINPPALETALSPMGPWTAFTAGETIINLPEGTTVYFRRSAAEPTTIFSSQAGYWKFSMTSPSEFAFVEAHGNVMSLLDQTCQSVTVGESAFCQLFYQCKVLTTAPKLPATELAESCYRDMFSGCAALTTVPELPATELARLCYSSMFSSCTTLTTAPKLPATTMATSCYADMFSGCAALTKAPELPATTLTNNCYYGMFQRCTALTDASALPATTLAESCYVNMFSGCAALTKAPELPATTLTNNCYYGMFQNCTSLTNAPALLATELAESCYELMFKGCRALTNAPALPATELAERCYNSMFSVTALTNAPALPATMLAERCYSYMFSDCMALTDAPALSATTLEDSCYRGMFSGCTALTDAPALSAETLAVSCYASMFSDCTSLTNAPVLPAAVLTNSCYNTMFSGCTNVDFVSVGFTNWPASFTKKNAPTRNWLSKVSATGTFEAPYELDVSVERGVNSIPVGWNVVGGHIVVTLPAMDGGAYVVSNLTEGAEAAAIAPKTGSSYWLPVGARVEIYCVPAEGYVVHGTNPYVIPAVAADTVIDPAVLPVAEIPSKVRIVSAKSARTEGPWSGAAQIVYELSDLHAGRNYALRFELTAAGQFGSCTTNLPSAVVDGVYTQDVNRIEFFGPESQIEDPAAELTLKLIEAEAKDGR